MPDFFNLPKEQAIKAYEQTTEPSLTDQLLYAILAQLDKINCQLESRQDAK
jgi:hypothetical protein